MPTLFNINVGSAGFVTGLHYAAAGDLKDATILLAHGAGARQLSPFMVQFAEGLSSRGFDVATFNFVYAERGRRAPDPKTRLELCYRAAIDTTRAHVPSARARLIVGGKSMGGRIASQVVASDPDGLGVAGLVFLGYPLHPPGRPEKRRDAHLPSISAATLFVQGSRDTFGTEDEVRSVVETLPNARLYVVKGGDHSLKVRGKSALSVEEVHTKVQDVIVDWVATTIP